MNIAERKCVDCGQQYQPTGVQQKRCASCAALLSAPKTDRALSHKHCNACGNTVHRSMWPKDASGTNLKHCGCRRIDKLTCVVCGIALELSSRYQNASKYCPECFANRRAEYKRVARIKGAPGFNPVKHDAHVNVWKEHCTQQCRRPALIGPPWPPKFRDASERERYRMRTDPRHVLNLRMRVSLRKAMRGEKAGRKWESLLGYSVSELTSHMRKQLPKGYSMQDFYTGRLHIDHIVPKCLFDVTNLDEMRACWGLPNLRPLPAKENLSKNAKRTHLL